MKDGELLKNLDAHFGRIIKIQSLTIGNWNSVITSSIDRTVKVWNINNIFEQVHVIDRHELQIDAIRYINKFRDDDTLYMGHIETCQILKELPSCLFNFNNLVFLMKHTWQRLQPEIV